MKHQKQQINKGITMNYLQKKWTNGSSFVILTTAVPVQTLIVRKDLWKESLQWIKQWHYNTILEKLVLDKKEKRKGECSGTKRDFLQLSLFWEHDEWIVGVGGTAGEMHRE